MSSRSPPSRRRRALKLTLSNPTVISATDVNRYVKDRYLAQCASRDRALRRSAAQETEPERPATPPKPLPHIFDNAGLPAAVRQGRATVYSHDMHRVPTSQPYWSGHQWVKPPSQRELASIRRPAWKGRAGGLTTYQPAGHAEQRDIENPMLNMRHFHEQAHEGAAELVPRAAYLRGSKSSSSLR